MQAVIDLEPVRTAAAWRGDVLVQQSDWIYMLSDAQVQELESLGERFVEDDPDLRFVSPQDYPLVVCRDAVTEWLEDLNTGRGFRLVRGLKTHLYSDALSAAIYYILGVHMGEPMRQNEKGDLIGHVYATSDKKLEDPGALSAKIRDKLPFHSDSSDVVALMCLRPAREGGASRLVSGAQIYNEILERRPDLAPLLLEPFHWDWRRQDHEAPANTYVSPVVSMVDDVFSIYAGSAYVFTAQEYPEVPRLTPEQIEVLKLFDDITYEEGMAIDMDFRPGDIQWLSNYAALHSRTVFFDHPEPQRRRHLMRLWLHTREPRKLVKPFGRSVVQGRQAHRDASASDDQGRFHIVEAAVPRLADE
ncbi:taurine dioxygenase [Lampropedia cohaerens]|uniref:Taurine dioxygenase n=1 Tax=Lampropedia cohaerens TaxID=1610491 RepID=A0A0U1Q021_9BURK|nr:TauD/TfdA family dioxygenase [Lampropedia cohaerens]KKW68102.1 taurine dioxygenase [Lampropedia cohaerens]